MTAAAQARHLSLSRLERAAGQAFGYEEQESVVAPRGSFTMAHSGFALATVATALAATITYFV
ncbi:hypothetical protein ASG52_23930 [Methylobacterium sp. Leaf456]|uniref:hypothetical protein n=1 Tax=Methylobacterium sp. Leaf456 TaxID=1736382 RepID=UPI0006F1E360|nr:hypothetical protein [Methylobacterium sp. Leaf456]KQT56239.1 hypothetical protein ASG52_23930 [Methylobacterium sp. Leaf456]